MDHFNAMFEDRTTGSWWRQANGEAIVGPRKGKALAELESQQVTLAEWLALHPNSLIMQPDPALKTHYTKTFDYESGASRSTLTGTDTVSWHDKAWVVGITANGESKAYDWNRLRRETVINDVLGGRPIALVLAPGPRELLCLRAPRCDDHGRASRRFTRGRRARLRLERPRDDWLAPASQCIAGILAQLADLPSRRPPRGLLTPRDVVSQLSPIHPLTKLVPGV